MKNLGVEYRWLQGAELDLLEPTLAKYGWASLNPNMARALCAFDGEKLIAFLVLQSYPFIGPEHVDPSYRGNGHGIAGEMAKRMYDFVREIQIRGFIVIADSPFTEKLCAQFGMKRVDSPVFIA